ncbi:MAG: acetyl-CoA carboxylase biotin carboxyl carrier protein [Cytophagales bacterium]|nr:acetyl-CoA carboxylase biotin carboxyl carrier protein [Bernardetiaceae bacterium]MDW8203869.1 acetyl-CoA carboxylase biotin carboxyl carrier protein [Cytophagales bacterium]
MNPKEIQELISFIAGSGLDEVNIETADFKLRVKRHSEPKTLPVPTPIVANPQPVIAAPVITTPQPTAVETKPVETKEAQKSTEPAKKLVAIKSPMIGTFYRASKPENPPYVNVGDEVRKGQVVCIIEAMKLFNEIESEVEGRIVKVLVDNASPVEYDQELFLVEPF